MDRYLVTIDRAAKAGRLRITWRTLAVLSAAVALFALAGDGGVRSATSAHTGADPLDLLNLQAKANAFLILDTSGSMGDAMASTGSGNLPVGDTDPMDKLFTAKSVLKSVISDNQATVVFSFGTYDQGSTSLQSTTSRFGYYTTSTLSPNMVTNEIVTNGSIPVHRTTANTWTETDGTTQHYTLSADRFLNGVTYTFYSNGTYCGTTTGSATNPPTVTLVKVNSTTSCTAAALSTAVFTFAGTWDYDQWGTDTNSCKGYLNRVPLADCSKTDQLTIAPAIGPYLEPSLKMSTDGKTIDGYTEDSSGSITHQPTANGLRASGYTPIANSLIDLAKAGGPWDSLWPTIQGQITAGVGIQATFGIIVTDGADSCDTRTNFAGEDDANTMLRAAYDAQNLHWLKDPTGTGVTQSHFKTFVVYIGSNATKKTRSNWVAWGGTGMKQGTTGTGEATRWTSAPADKSGCPTCVDAFSATNTAELTAALKAAIALGQTGNFSDRAVIASVYEELMGDALDPSKRYATAVPVLFQSTWSIPGFQGHLMAYTAASGTTAQWDAGDKLLQTVSITSAAPFASLHGGATDANIASSSAMIKRRIYTSNGNGSNIAYTASNLVARASMGSKRVTLWPPDTTSGQVVDPGAGTTGKFDAELGLTGYATLAALQVDFTAACKVATAGTLPAGCSGSGALAQGIKEAREMILAHMAGADVSMGTGGPNRSGGELLYTASSWILAESTNAAPAVATPPPQLTATAHSDEWNLFVSGPAAGSATTVLAGFGLKLPDTSSTASNMDLKPVMTAVYLPSNEMLHALRAGPCPSSSLGCGTETGGEELWGFVPYDQLGKLKTRLISPSVSTKVEDRSKHNYMMAAPVRLAHVFVPGAWSMTSPALSGSGVWRTVLLAGRGPGGKYLTALDVTVPGPTTMAHLSTTPPIVMWNRGKGDGTTDYDGMGETWSVPAVGPVNTASGLGKEFVAFVGSGYTDVAVEGTTVYAIDVLTGDKLASYDADPGNGLTNSVVASPSLFQPNLLKFSETIPLAATDKADAVYFPTVNGRIYRWDLTAVVSGANPSLVKDYTSAQPIGVAMTLMNVKDISPTGVIGATVAPHVFATSGADSRVTTTSNFKMFGLRDDGSSAPPEVFTAGGLSYPANYRGTVQPVGVFDASGLGIVMFVGTKFTPADTLCVSQFDSVLYMLEAGMDKQSAYDLPGGGDHVDVPKQKVTDLGMAGGQPRLAGGLHPDAPLPPATQKGTRQPPSSVSIGPPPGLAPLAGTTSFKLRSAAACR
jgi:hypothetical protein